jgi:hypothetical protein
MPMYSMYMAVLPGPVKAFRRVKPERFANILKSMAPFKAFLKETSLDLTFLKLYLFVSFFLSSTIFLLDWLKSFDKSWQQGYRESRSPAEPICCHFLKEMLWCL